MVVYKSAIITEQLSPAELQALVDDFTLYKTTGSLPDNFGRDVAYDHMNTLPVLKHEEVRHLHLADAGSSWKTDKIPYYRTSDIHLVYCHGALDASSYLLMAILQPDAHAQARNNSIMMQLGIMAEKFRLQF